MKLLGQDITVILNQLNSISMNTFAWLWNILSWRPQFLLKNETGLQVVGGSGCVIIRRPGGFECLEIEKLKGKIQSTITDTSQRRIPSEFHYATVGYNIPELPPPLVREIQVIGNLPSNLVTVKVKYFSINYADICIRWGLYESALRYVGWPIIPGFDFAGTVEKADKDGLFKVGDDVFGFTLFGAYTTRLIVPSSQIRQIPYRQSTKLPISLKEAASIPAVAATALHAVALAKGWPNKLITKNRAALVHSAAGGVGTLLLQILKVQGFSPIVAVVGSSHKVAAAKKAGANYVIDKQELKQQRKNRGVLGNLKFDWSHGSKSDGSTDLWVQAESISPDGYAAIFDANGLETLGHSYDHLCRCGTLVTYGFHSNLPRSGLINPLNWLRLIMGLIQMPKFDPMHMVLESKAVCGFNLSFFADEHNLIDAYMQQIVDWVDRGDILPVDEDGQGMAVKVVDMRNIRSAHALIQSGSSIGKIVVRTPAATATNEEGIETMLK